MLGILFALLLSHTPSAEAANAPERLVSLDLCIDWLLAYHAAPEQAVTLSPLHLRYPPPFEVPDWPVHDGSLEQIFRLAPKRVIVGQYNALLLKQRLRALEVPVADLALPTTLNELVQYERQFLQLIDQPTDKAQPTPMHLDPEPDAPRLLLLGANGIGTGANTFEDQILRQAGWRNYLTEPGYLNLDLEALVADPPDAVIGSASSSPSLANRFAEHPALARAIPEDRWLSTDQRLWQCPGPWTWKLIEQLRQQRVQ